jgi:putative ABC transport system permease protein
MVAFGIIALILSTIGVYALMANSVVERRREIGIRMALGARRSHVLWTVMNRSLTATGVGRASGITLALVCSFENCLS